jgi:hypothetical protein
MNRPAALNGVSKPKSRGLGAPPEQLELFRSVLGVYVDAGEGVENEALYDRLVERGVVEQADMERREPIGAAGTERSVVKRRVRWYQQTLKHLGLVERVPDARGNWRATEKARAKLTPAPPRVTLLGFSTDLGVAIWGCCTDVFNRLDEPIVACISSPPYPLARPRAYGNPSVADYTDFVCRSLEGVVRHLVRGGTIALNLSNDVLEQGSPARALYKERLVLALHERLGLHKLDELIWANPSKPPGPVRWASMERMLLNVAYEPVLLICNDPRAALADNRRVLVEHTERHLRLMRNGGESRERVYGDGAYRLHEGSFGRETPGRIPRNVLTIGHRCGELTKLRAAAAAAGLPPHGATMPLRLAKFLVSYLSGPGDLCVDPFAGWFTLGKAAEELGRRWIGTEMMLEYVQGARLRFLGA